MCVLVVRFHVLSDNLRSKMGFVFFCCICVCVSIEAELCHEPTLAFMRYIQFLAEFCFGPSSDLFPFSCVKNYVNFGVFSLFSG